MSGVAHRPYSSGSRPRRETSQPMPEQITAPDAIDGLSERRQYARPSYGRPRSGRSHLSRFALAVSALEPTSRSIACSAEARTLDGRPSRAETRWKVIGSSGRSQRVRSNPYRRPSPAPLGMSPERRPVRPAISRVRNR